MIPFFKKYLKIFIVAFFVLFVIAFFIPFFTVNRLYKTTNERVIFHLYLYENLPYAFKSLPYFFQHLFSGKGCIYPLAIFWILFILCCPFFIIKNKKFIFRFTAILSLVYLFFFSLLTLHMSFLINDFGVGEDSLYNFQAYPSIGYYIYAFLAVIVIIGWSVSFFNILKKRLFQTKKD